MNNKLLMPHDDDARAGFVALLGAPNAGKSTLMNQLVGAKVSIVTHKVQTTRAIIRGIVIRNKSQVIFVDTPGIFKPRRRLDTAMVTSAWGGAREADIVAFLIDCERGITDAIETILGSFKDIRQPKILILNKIDTVAREQLLTLSQKANALAEFDHTFMISALNGDGCDDFMNFLETNVPAGPWLYPEDQISDLPLRQAAAEITREKIYLRLHQELPYSSHVETEGWKKEPKGGIRIEQIIYVERDSQKKIVIGKSGATIKAISMAARKEISQMIGEQAHLFLFVKVRENWVNDPERYREMGLDFPKG